MECDCLVLSGAPRQQAQCHLDERPSELESCPCQANGSLADDCLPKLLYFQRILHGQTQVIEAAYVH